jgi:hypothetical protein
MQKEQIHERQKIRWRLLGAGGKGNNGIVSGYRVSVWNDERFLKIDNDDYTAL